MDARQTVSILIASMAITLATTHVCAKEKSTAAKRRNPPKSTARTQGDSAPAAAATKTRAAKTYDLRYKLKRGEVLRYDVTHRASVRSTIEQQTQAAQTRTDSVKVWKVIDVLKNGEIEIVTVVDRLHMVNQLPDKDPLEYDSVRDKTPPPGFEDAARAVGVPLSSIRITPRGKIERRDSKIRGATAEDDAPVALRLPEKPVAIGDSWDEPFDVVVAIDGGGKKNIETRRHHELAKVEGSIATIKVTYQVLSPIDAPIECQLVQRLMDGEVKFDIEAGRVVGQRMEIDKRILGFAGPTSSMQYIMLMEEKLLDPGQKVADNWPERTTVADSETSKDTKTASRPDADEENDTVRR
jgi:hypothetical protein